MSTDINIALPNQHSVHQTSTIGEVNCINVKAIYDHILRKAPSKAGMLFENLPSQYVAIEHPEVQLTDENNWVSAGLIVQILKNAKEILNDEDAPYHIGFETISQANFGYIQKFFITAFVSPRGALKKINQINSQFNRTKVVETVYNSSTRAVVRLHWKESCVVTKDICSYNKGIYAAIPTIWRGPPATIEEPFCQFNGDPYCQFNISFRTRRKSMQRLFFGNMRSNKSRLLSALEQIENDKLVLKKKYDEVNALNLELAENLEKLRAINTASNILVSRDNTEEILSTTMNFIVNMLQFDRAIIMMMDENETQLNFRYSYGADQGEVDRHLKDYSIPLTKDENILARVAKQGRPTMVKDVKSSGLRLSNTILANFDVSSFVICPLLASEGIIGILAADRYKTKIPINEKDMDDLAIFTNTIAETLHKAQLREEIEASYLNTVRALVRAIEEKDSYTRGHSERVSTLSVEIGRVLGISEKELEYLRLGCLLHDVGKIGISESIVRSPKALSNSEYTIIKQHPIKGAEIAQPVSFLKDHLYIIRNHHERFDGTGYPDGLTGDEIPLGAQITCVADAYDAITSTRPYRKGLPPQEATKRIHDNEGSQFNPLVVDAFKKVYRAKAADTNSVD